MPRSTRFASDSGIAWPRRARSENEVILGESPMARPLSSGVDFHMHVCVVSLDPLQGSHHPELSTQLTVPARGRGGKESRSPA